MTHLHLCSDCWKRVGIALSRAQLDEPAFLRWVAAQLQRCASCRQLVPELLQAIETSPLDGVWEAADAMFENFARGFAPRRKRAARRRV